MSSYVTSPYYIEQRRLQGIVNQCAADLQCALDAVEKQRQEIEKQKKEQLIQDVSYFREQELKKHSYRNQKAEEQEQYHQKKAHLKKVLHNIQIELQVYMTKAKDMQSLMEQQKRLTDLLEYESVDLKEVEKKVYQHIDDIQTKVSALGETVATAEMPAASINYGKREKGISLAIVEEEQDTWIEETPAEELFMQKLETILQSSNEVYHGEIVRLKRQFEEQPEYKKTVFAVEHMKDLDVVLQRVKVQEEQRKQKKKEYQALVDKYQAICSLLELEPDDKYMNDVDKMHILKKQCEKLYQSYEELQKNKYVYQAVVTVMSRYGIEVYNEPSNASKDNMHFQLEHANLEVSGIEHNQMIMEVSGEYDGVAPTLNDKRQSVAQAQKFCSILDNIYDDLEYEFGITFTRIMAKRPSEESITMKQKTEHVSARWYKGKAERSI